MNMARIKRDPKKVALAQAIIDAYNIILKLSKI